MARIPRILISGESFAYHIISRTALPGYPIEDIEKDFFVDLLKRFSALYFTELFGFAVMSDHFHFLVRMKPESDYSNEMIRRRYEAFYGKGNSPEDSKLLFLRDKYANLSEFIREIKQNFTRFFNKRHNRRGYFWGDRFKSLVVENGETLISCMAYIDLNPVRAGLVKRPEDYRWNSIGYHVQHGIKGSFLSLNFGLDEMRGMKKAERLRYYRRFVYEVGTMDSVKSAKGDRKAGDKDPGSDFDASRAHRFMHRNRYFSDSGIIGSKAFVAENYQRVKNHFQAKHEKLPKRIKGLEGIYSLKRLTE